MRLFVDNLKGLRGAFQVCEQLIACELAECGVVQKLLDEGLGFDDCLQVVVPFCWH